MARRYGRHYRGLVRFPGLGSLAIPKSVNVSEVAMGVALGFAGAAGVRMAASKLAESGTVVPAFVTASPLAGAALASGAVYMLRKKKNRAQAASLAVGSLLGGLAVWGYNMLQNSGLPGFSRYGAAIFDNPRQQLMGYGAPLRTLPGGYGGPIFDNPGQNLAGLAQLQGLGDEQEDGIFPAP